MLRPNQIPDDFILQRRNAEPFEATISDFWLNFIQSYREHVSANWTAWYEQFPSYFPFMDKLECVAVFNNLEIYFYIFKSDQDVITTEMNQYVTYGDLKKSRELDKTNDTHLRSLFKKHQDYLMFDLSYGFEEQGTEEPSENPSDLVEMGQLKGQMMANQHGEKLRKEKEERFSLFDLERYVLRVDDKHFEYEIAEAISAYRQGLYLASTAVAGVALENILMLILKKNNLHSKVKGSYIKDFLKVLVDDTLLEDRKRREIMNFNNLRNGAAHSNSGKVMAQHAEEGLAIIKFLIQLFY